MLSRDEHSDKVAVEMDGVDTIIYEKKAPQLERQHSTIFLAKDNNCVNKYVVSDLPQKKGAYGKVRFFYGESGDPLVVKSPRGEFKDPRDFDGVDLIASSQYFKQAYPELISSVHVWSDTFRHVMSKMPGVTLYEVLESCSEIEYIDIFLAVASELTRLHALGIAHGDINPFNILINSQPGSVKAYFVDFDHAYSLVDGYATTRVGDECSYWAPERNYCIALGANASQDIFSFALLLRHYQGVLSPEVETFLTSFKKDAVNRNANERPSLAFFINQLQDIKLRVTPHAVKCQP